MISLVTMLNRRIANDLDARMTEDVTANRHKTVGILSHSVIEKDPRVRKFANLLHENGWRVTSVGLSSDEDHPALPWEHYAVEPYKYEVKSKRRSLGAMLIKLGQKDWWETRFQHYAWRMLGVRLARNKWDKVFWDMPASYRQMRDVAMEHVSAAVWIANDWEMLPLATMLRDAKGGHVFYDNHEHATQQFSENREWRWFTKPVVQAIESRFIHEAAAISTVSKGIADALVSLYNLRDIPAVIPNVPYYRASLYRPAGAKLRVLYQGVIAQNRGLEQLIESAPYWQDHLSLVIRGPSYLPTYQADLERRIIEFGVEDRCRFAKPVAADQLVTAAQDFDIGVSFLTAQTMQSQYAMPNKIFEYMMAGLAICVGSNTDMKNEVTESQAGWVFEDLSPEALGRQLSNLSVADVNIKKQKALERAKKMCWNKESPKALAICEQLAFRR